MMNLIDQLFSHQDVPYQQFQQKLIPNIAPESIIGVRTPLLRRIARELDMADAFLADLPHRYFEENQIHSFLLGAGKDFGKTISDVNEFLPYVDNWATCDCLSPRVFGKHRAELLPHIRSWIVSEHPYTVRFGIKMLMDHFLDGDFQMEYPEMVATVLSDEYYVKMMQAWYFATALAKQYDAVIPYVRDCRLEKWTHNKTIQKAAESYRITPERKAYLKQLRIR